MINWTMFSELHAKTNEFTIKAEELSSNYYANLQMMKEERDCYSHLCSVYRAIGNEVTDSDLKQAEEALIHQYRALYDSMDWYSLVIRQQINKVIKIRRSALKKSDLLPNALLELKTLSLKIADYRINKDMRHINDEGSAITDGINKYIICIEKLEEIYEQLLKYRK